MDDHLRIMVLSNVFEHMHKMWADGEAYSPEAADLVVVATKILNVPLARDEVDALAEEVEQNSRTLETFDDMALFLIRRVREIGGPRWANGNHSTPSSMTQRKTLS